MEPCGNCLIHLHPEPQVHGFGYTIFLCLANLDLLLLHTKLGGCTGKVRITSYGTEINIAVSVYFQKDKPQLGRVCAGAQSSGLMHNVVQTKISKRFYRQLLKGMTFVGNNAN